MAEAQTPGRISFGEFKRVYTSYPYLVPWLNVLDRLSITTAPAATAATAATATTAASASAAASAPATAAAASTSASASALAVPVAAAGEEQPLLVVPLTDKKEDVLVLYPSDLSTLAPLKAKLAQITTEQLQAAFNASAAEAGYVHTHFDTHFRLFVIELMAVCDSYS